MDTPLYTQHSRFWQDNAYVYPVLSRRSQGISMGLNLTPGGECNFRCCYCQVRQEELRPGLRIDLDKMGEELRKGVKEALSGAIFQHPPFDSAPESLRRVNDLALSGDGEPTLSPYLERVVHLAAEVRQEALRKYPAAKTLQLVLITNATRLRKPEVLAALDVLAVNNGSIWAKLDAGTAEYYTRVNRSQVDFEEILAGITAGSQKYRMVLQTLFQALDGERLPDAELEAYIQRIETILTSGGQLDHIQLHTICRPPACSFCTPLPKEMLDDFGGKIAERTGVRVEVFGPG